LKQEETELVSVRRKRKTRTNTVGTLSWRSSGGEWEKGKNKDGLKSDEVEMNSKKVSKRNQ